MRKGYGLVAMAFAAACAGARQPPSPISPANRMNFAAANGTREFLLFRPASTPARADDRALVVMLHGCMQSADDMARGTRMNAAAEAGGFIVIYPEQPASAHPQKCWNWYLPEQSTRGRGEASLLAALIDSVARASGVSAKRVSIVGMSAGAAMAGNLAVAYPERYAALALHSGIPALGAKDVLSGLAAMRQGGDGEALGAAALAAMGERARALPVLAIHGADDAIVSPTNLAAIAKQWSVVNARAATPLPVVQRMLSGVGHAWSGGAAEGTFTAPNGPDATSMIVEFFRTVGSLRQ